MDGGATIVPELVELGNKLVQQPYLDLLCPGFPGNTLRMVGRGRIEHAKHVGEVLEAVAKLGLLGTCDVLLPLPLVAARFLSEGSPGGVRPVRHRRQDILLHALPNRILMAVPRIRIHSNVTQHRIRLGGQIVALPALAHKLLKLRLHLTGPKGLFVAERPLQTIFGLLRGFARDVLEGHHRHPLDALDEAVEVVSIVLGKLDLHGQGEAHDL